MFSNICGELQLWFNGEKEKSVLAAVLGNDEVYSVGAGGMIGINIYIDVVLNPRVPLKRV